MNEDQYKPVTGRQPRRILRYFIPQYDEVALFAMSLTCALLLMVGVFSTNWKVRFDLPSADGLKMSLVILFFLSGLALSLYHALVDRQKSSFEKYLMLFFAVIVNAFSGLYGGSYALNNATGWLAIFPILNIVNGIALLFLLRSQVLNEAHISDENAPRSQIAFTAVVVVILFVACHYSFRLMWIQTLSICVAYATNLGRRVYLLFSWVTAGA